MRFMAKAIDRQGQQPEVDIRVNVDDDAAAMAVEAVDLRADRRAIAGHGEGELAVAAGARGNGHGRVPGREDKPRQQNDKSPTNC